MHGVGLRCKTLDVKHMSITVRLASDYFSKYVNYCPGMQIHQYVPYIQILPYIQPSHWLPQITHLPKSGHYMSLFMIFITFFFRCDLNIYEALFLSRKVRLVSNYFKVVGTVK